MSDLDDNDKQVRCYFCINGHITRMGRWPSVDCITCAVCKGTGWLNPDDDRERTPQDLGADEDGYFL